MLERTTAIEDLIIDTHADLTRLSLGRSVWPLFSGMDDYADLVQGVLGHEARGFV